MTPDRKFATGGPISEPVRLVVMPCDGFITYACPETPGAELVRAMGIEPWTVTIDGVEANPGLYNLIMGRPTDEGPGMTIDELLGEIDDVLGNQP